MQQFKTDVRDVKIIRLGNFKQWSSEKMNNADER